MANHPDRWQRLIALLKDHGFRATMSGAQLEAHRRELADVFDLYGYDTSDEDDDEGKGERPPDWNPSRFAGHLPLFRALFKSLYRLLSAVGAILERRRRKPPTDRPLRVLRMASRIRQGGVAKVYLQSSLAMPRDRVEYRLWPFAQKGGGLRRMEEKLGLPITRYKLELWPASYRFSIFADILRAARVIRRTRPDLVHVHEPQFVPAVRMAAALAGGVPVVAQLHSDYNGRMLSIPPEMQALTRHALRRSHLLACSATIREAAGRWLNVPSGSVGLAEDGADDRIDFQDGAESAAQLKAAAGGRTVVAMMAHIKPFKRIGDFLLASRRLLDAGEPLFVLLMCYGKPKRALRLKQRFDRLFAPEQGQFLFQPDGPQHLLPAVDIGISTSILEGLGLNVLEYQSAGAAVVCTDIPAHREMVEDGVEGLLFEPKNVGQLAQKIQSLARDTALRKRLAEAGRRRAGRRRWADTAAKVAAFYARTLGRGAGVGKSGG
jgi:glycosyltransferase involved in cell wall biosynthesis